MNLLYKENVYNKLYPRERERDREKEREKEGYNFLNIFCYKTEDDIIKEKHVELWICKSNFVPVRLILLK